MPESGPTPQVVVIGGGISGLAAAHRLSSTGYRVVLVEISPRLGGKVITEDVDGFLVEGGPDCFVAAKRSVIDLATELGIADQIISSRPEHRGSFVWWQGHLHPLPGGLLLMAPSRLGPLLRSSLLSWRGKLRVLADLVLPRRRGTGDESLESFVVRRLGREVLDRIAEPLIAGVHAAEPATMSLAASFPRFLEMERDHRSLILAARSAMAMLATDSGQSHFVSFREGMGQLTSTLAESLDGVDLRVGMGVTRLRRNHSGFVLDLSDGFQLSADGVILATPARNSAALLAETAPAAGRAIAEIGQVSTTAVTLGYRSNRVPSLLGTGFVVPAVGKRPLMGVSYLSQKWAGRVPSDDYVLLRAFLRRDEGDEEELIQIVRGELESMVGITARPVLEKVQSWEGGLHQYRLGHLERVARAETALASFPTLALAGAAFHGIGLNECVFSGRRAADRVAAMIESNTLSPVVSN